MAKLKNSTTIIPRQFQFYVLIGVTAFIVEYGSFLVALQISDNLFLAQTCSFLLGLAVSFLGNRNITFRSNGEYALSRGSQLWRYVLLAFFNLILSNILIHILVTYMVAMVAKLAVMAAVILWNYAIFNKIIFRSK